MEYLRGTCNMAICRHTDPQQPDWELGPGLQLSRDTIHTLRQAPDRYSAVVDGYVPHHAHRIALQADGVAGLGLDRDRRSNDFVDLKSEPTD